MLILNKKNEYQKIREITVQFAWDFRRRGVNHVQQDCANLDTMWPTKWRLLNFLGQFQLRWCEEIMQPPYQVHMIVLNFWKWNSQKRSLVEFLRRKGKHSESLGCLAWTWDHPRIWRKMMEELVWIYAIDKAQLDDHTRNWNPNSCFVIFYTENEN